MRRRGAARPGVGSGRRSRGASKPFPRAPGLGGFRGGSILGKSSPEKGDVKGFGSTAVALFWLYVCSGPGNYISLPCTFTPNIISKRIKPSLQCTRTSSALIPLYLYPILDTVSKARPFEYLRLTSLSVIGALVKVDDTEVINFLVQSGVTPLCLRIMEMGNELSKTASTFIVQKILLDDIGLQYACATADRFFSVSSVLATMVISLADQPSTRVLKHVLRCYLRLTDDPRARIALQISLPEVLKDGTFYNCLREDPAAMQCLQRLLNNLFGGSVGGAPHPGPGHAPGGSPGGASQAGPSCAPGI
ncbi:cell differentiation protein rcd1-like isoform X4 [Phragmites australis]|uniref:cell differentiation protein rcd1-like isoform X4 n=1 Tax=Phragmites australis TaxID=29695 RepID=UPI002D76EF2D|nr:cell differentiation protein rcd1-like isoform X4 [Phragmites australis]